MHIFVSRLSGAQAEKSAWEAELDAWSVTPSGQDVMEPRHALRELEKAMPDNAMVSTDIGGLMLLFQNCLNY